METAYVIAEKAYYIYLKLPNVLKLLIKATYSLIKFVYIGFRKVYRLIIKKEDQTEKVISVELSNKNPDKIEMKNFYLKSKKLKKDKLKISWVIPLPIEGSGGHRNFYRVIRYLASQGHSLTVYIDPEGYYLNNGIYTGEDAANFIKENFFDLNANVIMGLDNIDSCDILFATHNSGAYFVKDNEAKAKLCCYFIQDYECMFFPMGDDYLRAYETYKFGFYPITSGFWPLNFLKRDFNIDYGYGFKFPINTDIYNYNLKFENKKNQIVFFAKPNMPRRCYQLGKNALRIVKQLRPEVNIVFYGQNSNDYSDVDYEFENRGIVPTINELAELYRESSIGLAFSTTNPSLVPYEMMACGCAVVDLDFNNNIISYESNDNIMLADPEPNKIANAIIKLLDDDKLREKQAKNGMKLCENFPTELEMCEGIEKELIKVYKKQVENNEKNK